MKAKNSGWLALCAVLAANGALAQDRLGVRPGMTLAEASAVLKPRCPGLLVTGDDEKYLSCTTTDGAMDVEATASPQGRIYYISWAEPASETDVLAYTQRVAGELGFSGKGKDCRFYDYELRCWTKKDGTTLYSGERDDRQRYVSYLVNETIETEDIGAPVAAPVTGGVDP
ncbi:MAG: hypothetical protein AB7I79_12615 [Rhizobiaceae bacterium]